MGCAGGKVDEGTTETDIPTMAAGPELDKSPEELSKAVEGAAANGEASPAAVGLSPATHDPSNLQQQQTMMRAMSALSEKALGQLSETQARLAAIEARLDEIASAMKTSGTEREAGLFKTELALLEAQSKQLEAAGVDNIYTSDLGSGKQVAKAAKKDMLQRFEVVFSRIDQLFADVKATEASAGNPHPL